MCRQADYKEKAKKKKKKEKKREETEKEIDTEIRRQREDPQKDRDSSRAIERTNTLLLLRKHRFHLFARQSFECKKGGEGATYTHTRRKIRPVDATTTERDR